MPEEIETPVLPEQQPCAEAKSIGLKQKSIKKKPSIKKVIATVEVKVAQKATKQESGKSTLKKKVKKRSIGSLGTKLSS